MSDKLASLRKLSGLLNQIIRGKEHSIELLLTAILAEGHILLHDVPGTGKTTLAKALAAGVDGAFQRIQFTPDLLPADILGTSIYQQDSGVFTFHPGPIFANIVLADEINRASPRTQSALLEAMTEPRISIDGKTHALPTPFLVLATENPVEFQGTYPLPEAQLDRFMIQLTMGYPEREAELNLLFDRLSGDPISAIQPVLSQKALSECCREVRGVHLDRSVAEYMQSIIAATRQDGRLSLGASPRSLLQWSRAAQAKAYLDGREFVLPDDARSLAGPILAHRLRLDNKTVYAGISAAEIVAELVGRTPLPR